MYDREIWSIMEDKDKNLWTGTMCGAKKLARYGFTTYTEADGTDYQHTNSIFENAAGELFRLTTNRQEHNACAESEAGRANYF